MIFIKLMIFYIYLFTTKFKSKRPLNRIGLLSINWLKKILFMNDYF